MRARYKKVLKPAIKAIKVLNQAMEQSSKFKSRYFIKPIAFITRPEDRAKNNNYVLIMRFYDKETGQYIEEISYVKTARKDIWVPNFARFLYEHFKDFVYFVYFPTDKDYRKITQEETIKRGHNIHSDIKYTKRKD